MALRVNSLDHAVGVASVGDLLVLPHLLQKRDWLHVGAPRQDLGKLGWDPSTVDRQDLNITDEVVSVLELFD